MRNHIHCVDEVGPVLHETPIVREIGMRWKRRLPPRGAIGKADLLVGGGVLGNLLLTLHLFQR